MRYGELSVPLPSMLRDTIEILVEHDINKFVPTIKFILDSVHVQM